MTQPPSILIPLSTPSTRVAFKDELNSDSNSFMCCDYLANVKKDGDPPFMAQLFDRGVFSAPVSIVQVGNLDESRRNSDVTAQMTPSGWYSSMIKRGDTVTFRSSHYYRCMRNR